MTIIYKILIKRLFIFKIIILNKKIIILLRLFYISTTYKFSSHTTKIIKTSYILLLDDKHIIKIPNNFYR